MSPTTAQGRTAQKTEGADSQEDRYHRKLQRILRSSEPGSTPLSGGVSPIEQRRMSEQRKSATLAPRLLNPRSVPEDDSPLFQCTECDMIVKESDPYCPFCGAIFADVQQEDQSVAGSTDGMPDIEKPARREPMVRPEKFDLFSLIKTKPASKELLYHEALKGFAGSARLLEEIEHLISDISTLGTDTSKARRLVGSAWEACRDGDWNLVSTLARQTEELVSPSIPDLVRSQIAKARNHLTEAKGLGVDISPYILQVKSAMQALHANNPDEALRITKELMDRLREDSISWK
jgi:hypothetical protein